MIPARLLLPALLLLAATGAGCAWVPGDYTSSGKDMPEPESWLESEIFLCHDLELLWETAKIQAAKNGFRIDDDATSFTRRRVVTTWKNDLATAQSEGKRRRRFVEFREIKDAKDAWKVRVCTALQRNVDLDSPLDPASADWRQDAPDEEDAERLAFLIESQFRDYGPSKESEYR